MILSRAIAFFSEFFGFPCHCHSAVAPYSWIIWGMDNGTVRCHRDVISPRGKDRHLIPSLLLVLLRQKRTDLIDCPVALAVPRPNYDRVRGVLESFTSHCVRVLLWYAMKALRCLDPSPTCCPPNDINMNL